MSIMSKVADVLSGGVGSKVLDIVAKQFPGKLSAQEMAALDVDLQRLDLEKQREASAAIADAEKSINERIGQYEGTAADIKDIFFIGPLVILVRALFRPVCSYVTLYIDYLYFSSDRVWAEGTPTLLVIINVIVLGFWFGERTAKNVMPLMLAWLDSKNK